MASLGPPAQQDSTSSAQGSTSRDQGAPAAVPELMNEEEEEDAKTRDLDAYAGASADASKYSCMRCELPGSTYCPKGCRAAVYCSSSCQERDRSTHKPFCAKILAAERKLERERRVISDMHCTYLPNMERTSYFDDYYIGKFWGHTETRPYCRARLTLCNEYRRYTEAFQSKVALEQELHHACALLWLNRNDGQGVRCGIVSQLLLLDRVQDAYDFIKWWRTSVNGRGLTPADCWMDLRGADLAEPVVECDWLFPRYSDDHWLLQMLLIKIVCYLEAQTHTSSVQVVRDVCFPTIATVESRILSQLVGEYVGYAGSPGSVISFRQDMTHLAAVVHQKNPFVFKYVLHGLSNVPAPEYTQGDGHWSEAHSQVRLDGHAIRVLRGGRVFALVLELIHELLGSSAAAVLQTLQEQEMMP